MNYEAYYQQNLKEATEFQDHVFTLFLREGLVFIQYGSKKYQFGAGENSAGIEIKFDRKLSTTGNLYIETAEKSHPSKQEFSRSGIYRTDNTWLFVIGDYHNVFVFSKKLLQHLHKTRRYPPIEKGTSRGFLLPEEDAKKYAAKVLQGRSSPWPA